MNPLDINSHYKCLPYQPVTLITKVDLNFIQGNIVKYVSRYKKKNGKEDLLKAIHYAQLGQELAPQNNVAFGPSLIKELHDYVEQNNFDDRMSRLLMQVAYQNWLSIAAIISTIIEEYD